MIHSACAELPEVEGPEMESMKREVRGSSPYRGRFSARSLGGAISAEIQAATGRKMSCDQWEVM